MRILITGASGMVGRNLLAHPFFAQNEVLAPPSSTLNLLNPVASTEYVKAHAPDLIIHAAGTVGGIQANLRQPVKFLLDNLNMGQNLVMAAAENGVKQLLNLGSSCMYPRGYEKPLLESQVLQGQLEPTNEGYALAKIMTARLCEYVEKENPELQYKTLIPCNLYGRFDTFDPSHSHLIPAIIHKVHQAKIQGKKTVEIWGDGTARREFMYAADLADFIAKAAVDYTELPALTNVGLGQDYTVNEYYQVAAEVIGFAGNFTHDTTKPVGMKRKLVDVTRQSDFGWFPSVSLQEGIQMTYDFYLNETTYGR